MSLENSPVSRLKQNAVIKLHCLLTAVSFSFAFLPSSLVAFSSPAYAQPITIAAKTVNSDAAGILIAAKSDAEVKAPNSTEVAADSESGESSDKEKKSDDKKSSDKKNEDKKSKAKEAKASAKDDKAKDDKTKDDKSKAKDEKTKADKSKDDKAKDKKAEAKEDSKDDKKKAAAKRGFFGRAK